MPRARRPTALFLGLYVGVAGAGAWSLARWLAWPPLTAWLVAANLTVLPLWAWDKRRAQRGGLRVPEPALHLAGLAGGALASLLARRWLRHKTQKRAFLWWPVLFLVLQGVGIALWIGR